MKKYVIGASIAVFFLVVVTLILIKVLHSSPTSSKQTTETTDLATLTNALKNIDTSTPQNTAYVCFAWYVNYYASVTSIDFENISSNPTAQRCFSPAFIATWKFILMESEADPVLISSGSYQSWLSTIKTKLLQETAGQARVGVTLGSQPEQKSLTATLVKGSDLWQIDSVTED